MDCGDSHSLESFTNLIQQIDTAGIEETIAGPAAQTYIGNFNRMPPPSDYEGIQVTVYAKEGVPSIYMVIVDRKGCIVVGQELLRPVHEELKKLPKNNS